MTVVQVRVGEVAEQIRGVTYGKGDAIDSPQDGYLPVLRAGNITDGGVLFEDLVHVPTRCASSKQLLRAGDVLIAASSGSLDVVGKAAPILIDYEGAFGAFCKVLRPDQGLVHPSYFAHYFKTTEYRRIISGLAAGANINNLRNEHLDELLIPLPPLPEQHRIATILDKAEALRTKRREALAQLDRLAQAIFVEMFGDPVLNPLGLQVLPLIEIAQGGFQNGAYFPKEMYSPEGVEMVHMSDAFGGVVERGHLKRVRCENQEIAKYSLGENDILIARRSLTYEGAAKPCRVPRSSDPLIFESSFIRVCPDLSKVNAAYLFNYLDNERVRESFVRPYVTQSTISGINQSNLARIPLMLPPIGMQEKFSNYLKALDRTCDKCAEALRLSDALFSSLQHQAFRGDL